MSGGAEARRVADQCRNPSLCALVLSIDLAGHSSLLLPLPTPTMHRFFNDVQTGNSSFKAGTRTTVAGAIIVTMASFVLVFLIGLHDEDATWDESHKGEGCQGGQGVGRGVLCCVRQSSSCRRLFVVGLGRGGD